MNVQMNMQKPDTPYHRILAMYEAKSVNTQPIKNLRDNFLTKGL